MIRTGCRVFAAVFIFVFACEAASADSYIVLESGEDKSLLQQEKTILKEKVESEEFLRRLFGKFSLKARIERVGDKYLLWLGPLKSDRSVAVLFYQLKKSYPDAFVVPVVKNEEAGVRIKAPIAVIGAEHAPQSDNLPLWIALFALAVTGIFALFVSSRKIQKINEQHKDIKKRHEEIEGRQHELFSDLGESIYNMSKDVVQCTKNVISEVKGSKIGKELHRVITTENKILDTTGNLLGFLKLKAKKVEIKESPFNLNVVLDDIVGSLVGKIRTDRTELIFDIDRTLPKKVVGDFAHIGEILSGLLEYALSHSTGEEVKVDISLFKSYSEKDELQFRITFTGEEEPLESYFVPYYDEKCGKYRRLGLFVAHELSTLMEGELSVQKQSGSSEYFLNLTIPIKESPDEQMRKYPLPDKKYTQKDVLIVNRNYNASLSLKKMFAYFKHRVRIFDAGRFEEGVPDITEYDIVLIDEMFIDENLLRYIEQIKKKKEIKVIGLRNIFDPNVREIRSGVLDSRLTKPFNQEKVFSLIKYLYTSTDKREKVSENDRAAKKKNRHNASEFLKNINETPGVTLADFSDFSGSRIMIVEDNEINRRMLLKVLEKSGIEILVAENGLEAVEQVEMMEKGEPDLILMDINMPIMDGYTATLKIRNDENHKTVPIVALTALTLESEIDRMKISGLSAFLPKPLNISQLYTALSHYLPGRSHQPHTAGKSKVKPEKLKGIDIDIGLQHSNGNELVYKEVLAEFLDIYGDTDRLIDKLYTQKRFEQLKQLLLDLMGLTGTIGAKRLYAAANEMYKLYLYNKLSLMRNFTKEFTEALNELKESITQYLIDSA